MRSVVMTRYGPARVLQVRERSEPQPPGVGQVSIEVEASGVNFADVLARLRLYPEAPKPPDVVGFEVAGTVLEVGSGVTGRAPGDRVFAGTRFGGYSERVTANADDVFALPERLSFSQGAAIPVNYLTAWLSLVSYGDLQRDQRVLIHGAAGGVGVAAIQIGRALGGELWGTASPGKHEAILELGLDHALDYTAGGWDRDLSGFDVILDPLGPGSWRRSRSMLRQGGRVIGYGAADAVKGGRLSPLGLIRSGARMPRPNLIKEMWASRGFQGLSLLGLWDDRGALAPFARRMWPLVDDGSIDPVIAEEVPFAEAPRAHEILTERRNIGKVVLVPG